MHSNLSFAAATRSPAGKRKCDQREERNRQPEHSGAKKCTDQSPQVYDRAGHSGSVAESNPVLLLDFPRTHSPSNSRKDTAGCRSTVHSRQLCGLRRISRDLTARQSARRWELGARGTPGSYRANLLSMRDHPDQGDLGRFSPVEPRARRTSASGSGHRQGVRNVERRFTVSRPLLT